MILHTVAVMSLAVGVLCAAAIAADIALGRRQKMWIMNLVWPLTALYAGPLALYAYWHEGRRPPPRRAFWKQVALGAAHCGSGCTLGDLVAEWFVVLVPFTLFRRALYGTWALDFVAAFGFGIAFQYFTIAPMRGLGLRAGLVAALKADAASLCAWQLGMYGWIALVVFVLFGRELEKTSPEFWFMMQLAMLAGFATSCPVNAWLLRRGLKEPM